MNITENGITRPMTKEDLPKLREALGLRTHEPQSGCGAFAVAGGSTDRRSPLARARDDFLQSDEGAKCCDPTTLKAPRDQRQYLENRIARAFLAGAEAAEKLAKAGQ